MARFHELTVTDVHKTIRNAVVVTLEPGPDSIGVFEFTQGQYLTFRRDFDGQELRRSYSICTGKNEGILQVGIKQVEGGAFSTWANENLKPGDVMESMPPMGSFYGKPAKDLTRNYLAFAGGSGITPILSILKTTLSSEPESHFTLVYANQGAHTIMFREELEDLKNIYLDRLAIVHILETQGQDSDLFTGRVDGQKCADLFKNWIDVDSIDLTFICGPEPMMLAISEALQEHGVDKDKIQIELFAGTQSGLAPQRPTTGKTAGGKQAKLSVVLDGTAHEFSASPEKSILQATLEQSIDAPFSCRAGVCSSCRCRVLSGQVEMVANHALEDYEVEKGYVLACQSYPVSDEVRVDFDQ